MIHTGDTQVKLSGDTRRKVWYGKYLKWLIVVLFILLLALKAVPCQPTFLLFAPVLPFFSGEHQKTKAVATGG